MLSRSGGQEKRVGGSFSEKEPKAPSDMAMDQTWIHVKRCHLCIFG